MSGNDHAGPRNNIETMYAFISKHQFRPVIDPVVDFENAPAAFDSMENGNFMGEIVIRTQD